MRKLNLLNLNDKHVKKDVILWNMSRMMKELIRDNERCEM